MKLYPNYNFDNVDALCKIIITSKLDYTQPERYFFVSSPEDAVKILESNNVELGLLVWGGKLSSSFYAISDKY